MQSGRTVLFVEMHFNLNVVPRILTTFLSYYTLFNYIFSMSDNVHYLSNAFDAISLLKTRSFVVFFLERLVKYQIKLQPFQ